ncbi:transcriptional regulator [Rhodococcoides trifolii]|uniref:Transcriptional regulator n=1 Tax=Rhodococcoides trifolii TaxID=908250 RepID=A0A917CW90_9NOCA|nr:MarR family transcriptional regulator [Rhodococcus trifolii]GGG01894.1 transcriptional regulator [Rhodococcus trifolii]
MHSRDRDLSDSFMTVARDIRRRQMSALEPFGLSPSHSRALRVLARADEPVRLGYLAERLHIVPRSATDVIDALEQSGHVHRRSDPADRRAVLIELTASGRTLVSELAIAQRRTSSDLFDVLDPAERDQLRSLLDRIQERSGAPDHL